MGIRSHDLPPAAGGRRSVGVTDVFSAHRALLFSLAYRMLATVAEAEDLVQETYVRWQRQDPTTITTPKAWLVTTITRLAIDQLRSARHRREDYVGMWLPEPIVDDTVPAPDAAAARADSLGVAFLVMLEALTPVERAVFLLREAFDYDYAEIAAVVDKSEANCRQLFSRAKSRLAAHPAERLAPSPQAENLVRRFMNACMTGHVADLLATLTDDAVLYTDGGGRVRAALRPILGSDRISRFYAGIHERAFVGAELRLAQVNGDLGVLLRRADGHVSVMTFAWQGDRIRSVYTMMNPDKLQHVAW